MDVGDGNWIERHRNTVRGKDLFSPLFLSYIFCLLMKANARQFSYGLLLLPL